ncbi:hypothetical protein ANCCAN_00911 [Ancylostoma caninum]|uniref:Uncharacterized protein n=1 Tax=Ancylostoma caninum TaxID=29170 RepID=A0A368H8M6_ANCCA|nr:hypothetical protein ANCCAN_00911 [Ancylostoma caninum]
MEIVGSHCTYSDTKLDCVCIGNGCNDPKSFKKILAKEIARHRSPSRLQKLLCFLTDGDLFANITVHNITEGTPAPTSTTEEPEMGESTKPPEKKKTTKALIKKPSKPPKDSKRPDAARPGGGMKEGGESDGEFVRNLSLHVVFGLLLLLLIFANIVFFTLILYYKKKEEDERDKISSREPSGRKSKKKEKISAERAEPGSVERAEPGSAPGSAEGDISVWFNKLVQLKM